MKEQLTNYLRIFPDEENLLSSLIKQVSKNQNIFSRRNFEGHITASGLVISSDKKVLVVFHNKLQKFLQPGGHIEKDDKNIIFSAMREVKEETNLNNEEEHYHHDFMFIFLTKEDDITLDTNEVSDFYWVSIDEVIKNDSVVAKGLKKTIMLSIV